MTFIVVFILITGAVVATPSLFKSQNVTENLKSQNVTENKKSQNLKSQHVTKNLKSEKLKISQPQHVTENGSTPPTNQQLHIP